MPGKAWAADAVGTGLRQGSGASRARVHVTWRSRKHPTYVGHAPDALVAVTTGLSCIFSSERPMPEVRGGGAQPIPNPLRLGARSLPTHIVP